MKNRLSFLLLFWCSVLYFLGNDFHFQSEIDLRKTPLLLQHNGLRVLIGAGLGLWCTLLDLFKEYPVLRDVVLSAFNSKQIIETSNISEADVLFVGSGVGAHLYVKDLVPDIRNILTIFVQCENYEVTDFSHQYIESVDVSLGSSADVSAKNYQHTPCWILSSIGRDYHYPLQFSPDFFDSIEPEVWRARGHFAVQISNHGGFPRELLVDLLNQIGLVEQFGKWSKIKTDWPLYLLPQYTSNAYFFRHFRYAICPESQRSPSGGYTTEKIIMSHVAGAVPIFWGDRPTPQVFNQARILTLDAEGPSDPNLSHAIEKLLKEINQLENNSSFRREWFSRPILMPGAPLWIKSWISNVTNLIQQQIGRQSASYR